MTDDEKFLEEMDHYHLNFASYPQIPRLIAMVRERDEKLKVAVSALEWCVDSNEQGQMAKNALTAIEELGRKA